MQETFFPDDEARNSLSICRKIFEEVSVIWSTPGSSPFIETGHGLIRITRLCTVVYKETAYHGSLHLEEKGSFLVGNFSSRLVFIPETNDSFLVYGLSNPLLCLETHRNQNDGHGTNPDFAKLRFLMSFVSREMYSPHRWHSLTREMMDLFEKFTEGQPTEIRVIKIAA